MMFMFITTMTASWELIWIFGDKAAKASTATEALHYKVDVFLVVFMAALAVIVLCDMLYKWYGYLTGSRVITSSRTIEHR
jgi:hypothetical protein